MLTAARNSPITPVGGYGFMGGSYHWHEPAKRFYVSVYYKGKRYRIWQYNGMPLFDSKTAEKLVNKIRAEIDTGTINIKSYLKDSRVTIKSTADLWLQCSTAKKNSKRVYRSDINRAIRYFGPDFDIRNFFFSQLQTYYNDLHLSEKGKYNALNTLKTMLIFALKDELIQEGAPVPENENGAAPGHRIPDF